MIRKINVAILFGGRSAEHEISLLSAQNVLRALDKNKYEPVLIGIDKKGQWFYQADSLRLFKPEDPKQIALQETERTVLFSQNTNEHYIRGTKESEPLKRIDVIFPVLHGTFGEDGAVQGLAKLANIPCVGAGILGSAIGMDKEVMKRLLRDAGIDIADFVTLRSRNKHAYTYDQLAERLGTTIYVKPANLGSSVGISRVKRREDFLKALDLAFRYDHKVIVEEEIIGREIECAVLGNDNIVASVPGEVIPKDGFYSYEAKYVDESGAALKIPADLTEEEIATVQQLAIHTYEVLDCKGMARVDMFLCPDNRLVINEINTLPGFTNISMYPSLWKHSGLSNKALIDKLIELAIQDHHNNNLLSVEASEK